MRRGKPPVSVVSLYGNVALRREYCRACGGMAIVQDGKLACCDAVVETVAETVKRETIAPQERYGPGFADATTILEVQGGCCAYCDQRFGSVQFRGVREFQLRLCWDHWIPWSYGQNNQAANFVAACHVCNALKSSMLFASMDEARTTLASMRAARGYQW